MAQAFSRLMRKTRIRWIRASDRIRMKWGVFRRSDPIRSVYGIDLVSRWGDETFRLYLTGGYGFFLADFLTAIDEPFDFVDVGANQGLYSVIAARNPACRTVYAFEPVDAVATALEQNLALNRADAVRVSRKAISDRAGTIDRPFNPGHSGVFSLRRDLPASGASGAPDIAIETIGPAELETIIAPGARRIVVKIDVEGYEETVISTLFSCRFASHISDVFYEIDERWVAPSRLQNRLGAQGFERFLQVGKGMHYDVLASRRVPDGSTDPAPAGSGRSARMAPSRTAHV